MEMLSAVSLPFMCVCVYHYFYVSYSDTLNTHKYLSRFARLQVFYLSQSLSYVAALVTAFPKNCLLKLCHIEFTISPLTLFYLSDICHILCLARTLSHSQSVTGNARHTNHVRPHRLHTLESYTHTKNAFGTLAIIIYSM